MMLFLAATLLFVALQGFFSGIETGLISVRRPRLEHAVNSGSKSAMIVQFLLDRPGMMLTTLLVGTNACVVCASLSAKRFAESLGLHGSQVILVSAPLLTILLLAAEIIPKNWFRQSPFSRCTLFAYPLYLSYLLFFIPSFLISSLTDSIGRLVARRGSQDNSRLLMREDFRILLRESESAGTIDSEASALLDNAIDFHSLRARDAMIPRKDVKCLPADASVADAMKLCKELSISRLPVLPAGAMDSKWIGVFSVYDAIFSLDESAWATTRLESCMRPALSVSPDLTLGEILEASKFSSSPLLVVAEDKAGSGVHHGILTPDDIIKRLFG